MMGSAPQRQEWHGRHVLKKLYSRTIPRLFLIVILVNINKCTNLTSRKQKLIEKIKNNPQKIRFEELNSFLISIGFTRRQPGSGSSHFTYTLGELIITIPYKRPYVKEKYIKDAIELIEKLGY